MVERATNTKILIFMKTIITLFAFIVILALTGCGNASQTDNSNSTNAPATGNTNSSGGVTTVTNNPATTNSAN